MGRNVIIQAAVWTVFFFFWYQIVYVYVGDTFNRLMFTFFDIFLIGISFYFVYSFAVPKLLFRRKKILFVGTVIAGIVVSGSLLIWLLKIIFQSNILSINFRMTWNLTDLYNNRFSIAFFGALAGLVIRLSLDWAQSRKRAQQAEYEKTKAELAYLKNQVNPHFLFNALNTIYFQLDQSTEDARNSLLKFSDILRYQLYDCNEEKVLVAKEIKYLDNYIKIQKLRKEKNYVIEFLFDNSWTNEEIAPLLLISFVENAFKYVSDFTDRLNIIRISAKKDGNSFVFSCVNTFDNTKLKKDGLGISNVKRRLELIYTNRYSLDITAKGDDFIVLLNVIL